LDDIKDISNLPLLKKLDFGSDEFLKCNIVDIKGYLDFILTTVSSPYLIEVDE